MISNGSVLISYLVDTVNWLESWEGRDKLKDVERQRSVLITLLFPKTVEYNEKIISIKSP